jgi:hypothetical protein
LPEEAEFEMDLEVGGHQSISTPPRLPGGGGLAGCGEFEMDLELEASPPKLISRNQL